jgi:hypothetical protein
VLLAMNLYCWRHRWQHFCIADDITGNVAGDIFLSLVKLLVMILYR